MIYLTLDNKVIPQANILKEYLKGTCDYRVKVDCSRCFGRGTVHTYGVCFRCGGACKEIVTKKGYTQDQLKLKLEKDAKEKTTVQAQLKHYQDSEEKQCNDIKKKKAAKIQLLITIGGNSSDFSSSLASQAWLLLTTNSGKPFTEKQLIWVLKFLESGCNKKELPFDKISHYLNINI